MKKALVEATALCGSARPFHSIPLRGMTALVRPELLVPTCPFRATNGHAGFRISIVRWSTRSRLTAKLAVEGAPFGRAPYNPVGYHGSF